MAETESWRGTWWVAGEPEWTRQGILHKDDEEQVTLELVGGFDVQVRVPLPSGKGYSVKAESRVIDMIHGIAEGESFTLIHPHDTRTSGGIFGDAITKQDWSPQRVLKGIHLATLDERVFTRGHVQFEYLLHWTSRTTLSVTHEARSGEPRASSRVERQDQQLTAAARYRKTRIGLRVRSHDFNVERRPAASTTTVQTTEWAVLDIDEPEAVSYDAFDTIDKDLQDLLTFCAYAPAAAQGRSLIFETSDAHPGRGNRPNEVEIIGPQIYRGRSRESEKGHHDYLFTLDAIDFADLVPKWLALKERTRMGCNILFGLRYISQGYLGTRLLGIATAAENLHRGLRPATAPLSGEQYASLKAKLRSALVDEPNEIREFASTRLHNVPTYRDRLLDLANIPDAAVVDDLLTDRERWVKMLKESRNDLAHANERSEVNADVTPAFWLLEITYALLHLVLIAELGLGEDVQRKAMSHPRISWARAQFREVLEA